MYGVHINGSASAADVSNQLFLWGSGGTTSAMGFKINSSPFTNPTGNGDGCNTYLTMDTAGRGWVFGERTTGFSNVYTSGWILNNGVWQAQASMRAPIFYDSNNTGYYADLNGTTYCYYLQSATTVQADSDRRIKNNIETITNALDKVIRLRGTTFTRTDLIDKNKKYIGLIAQEVLEVIPEVVGGSEGTKYSVAYGEIVAVLIEAIKEQQIQINDLKDMIINNKESI
jgi:hypothetical protein